MLAATILGATFLLLVAGITVGILVDNHRAPYRTRPPWDA